MTIETKSKKSYVHRDKFLFWDYDNVDYNFGDLGYKTIKNFLHRFVFIDSVKDNISAWSYWIIRDKDTPEIISFKIYRTPYLYWIIPILNQMMNPDWDWPMTDHEVYNYSIEKYGIDEIYELHHTETAYSADDADPPAGLIVEGPSWDGPFTEINNLTYEMNENERKRKIKLLKPEHLSAVLSEFKNVTDSRFQRARG